MVAQGPIEALPDTLHYEMVSKLTKDDLGSAQFMINRLGRERAHILRVPDPFKTKWLLRGGLENLLMDYITDPELVHALSRIATDFGLALIEFAVPRLPKSMRIRTTWTDTPRTRQPRSRWCGLCLGCRQRPIQA